MNNTTINITNIHTIAVFYELLYQPGSYEFVSEFFHYTKSYFSNEKERKIIIIYILSYSISTNKIFVSKGTNKEYNQKNYNELISEINKNWEKFNSPDEVEIWYSYEIGYRTNWLIELKNINLNKQV